MPDSTPQESNPRTSVKLLTLGDCNTRGPHPDESLATGVARHLSALGHRCESVNWGHTMTTTREGLSRVIQERPRAHVVIINYGLVDSWVTSMPRLYVAYYPETRLRRLGRKALKFIKRRLRSARIRRWIPTGEVVSLQEYDRNLRLIVELIRRESSQALIVFWSTPEVQNDPDRNANIRRYNAQLQQIARDVGAFFVDTEILLKNVLPEASYVDAVHLNEASLARISSAIAEHVLSRIPSADTPHVAA